MFKKLLNKESVFLIAILAVFVLLIIPATGQIYHQDEYSWLTQMDGTDHSPQVHPPLYLFLGRITGEVIGFGHIRWVTVPFALTNVLLVYAVSFRLTRRRSIALIAAGLFALNAYSILAATMVDIDGALLPFFVLLAYLAYLHILDKQHRWYWVLAVALVGGFLSKLSFILFCGALIVDWSLRILERRKESIRHTLRLALPWLAGGVVLIGIVYLLATRILPGVVEYAAHFRSLDLSSRAYADLAYKLLKSTVFLGPLIMLGALTALFYRDYRQRYRFWWLYLTASLLFYMVIFDFTTLTIERYFMFVIAPLALIAAEPLVALIKTIRSTPRYRIILLQAFVVTAFVGALLFIPHNVLPLYPKDAFAHRALSLRWDFLVPITGGSGPIGFYVSALYTGLTWIMMTSSALFWIRIKSARRTFAAALFLSLGVLMTAVMFQEFLFGGIYGSPNRVAWETVNYVNANPDIHQVITYYNIAPYDLRLSGKYNSRFFVTLKRDYVGRINAWRGHYMIVEFPAIAIDDRYMQVITKCPIIKEFQDKTIRSYIYDCTKIPLP